MQLDCPSSDGDRRVDVMMKEPHGNLYTGSVG
jgi:hypothetical protein